MFKGCGTFSPEWRPSFDTVVELFQGLETDPRVDNDIGTYMEIFQDVLEKLYQKEGVGIYMYKVVISAFCYVICPIISQEPLYRFA